MRTSAAALAVVLSLLAAPAARAQPVSPRSGPDTYLELHLGAYLPQSSDLDAFDPGVAVSGTFGALFSRAVGAEASVGYYHAAASAAGTDTSLNVMPVLVSLRFVAPLKSAEISLRAGVGIHFASVHSTGGTDAFADTTAFGYHVGGSAAFNLSPTMLVGVDVLRTFVDAKLDGVETDIGGFLVAAKLGYRL